MAKNKKISLTIIAMSLFTLDLGLKSLALRALSFDFKLIKFGLSKNTGLFFWTVNQKFLILSSTLLLIFLIIILLKTQKQNFLIFFSLCLVGLGGISNLLDRSLRGFVVDYTWLFFLPFSWFNLADVMILSGLLLSLRFLLKQDLPVKSKKPIENK